MKAMKLAVAFAGALWGAFAWADTQTVDGVTWTYAISGGRATVGGGSEDSTAVPKTTAGAIAIPSELGGCPVVAIGDSAFYNCRKLISATIPEGVTNIGGSAFRGCYSLKSVTIPKGVTGIGNSAFEWCDELETVTIPEGVTSIGKDVFDGCSMLESVTIPERVTSIGACAFSACTSLKSVTIPGGVTNIGYQAFSSCSLLASVSLPTSLRTVGEDAFSMTPYGDAMNARMLLSASGQAGGSVSSSVTVVSTNVVLHYVVNGKETTDVVPPADTDFVAVVTEVKGGTVAIPQSWAERYPDFAAQYGTDFGKALTMPSKGKFGLNGAPMLVWQDYVAGTDPTDPNDRFSASLTFDAVTGRPVISWSPEMKDAKGNYLRKYTTWGKKSLADASWTEVPQGRESEYGFFKVTVEMK